MDDMNDIQVLSFALPGPAMPTRNSVLVHRTRQLGKAYAVWQRRESDLCVLRGARRVLRRI